MKDTKKNTLKKLLFKTNFFVLTAVIVVIAVLLNLIVELIPMDLDLTEEKLFTLTDTTEKIVENIKEDIDIYALYDRTKGESDTNRAPVIKVLDKYDEFDNVEVSYIDMDKKPAFLANTVGENNAAEYDEGDYIVKCGDVASRIPADDMYVIYEQTYYYIYTQKYITGLQVENEVTGAIVRVTSGVPVIYWSTAYGEADLSSNLYADFVEAIEDSYYDLKTIDLRKDEIPEDASAMIFMSPNDDLDDDAVDKLIDWFNHGGNAFFFMDVKNAEGGNILNDFKNFNLVFDRFSLSINNDIIEECDEYKYESDSDSIFKTNSLIAGALEKTPSTEVTVLNTRSINVLDTVNEYQEVEAILETSDDAISTPIKGEEEKTVGKKVIAASCNYTGGHAPSKIVLFGSSSNVQSYQIQYFGAYGVELVKDSLDWMNIETIENPADSIEKKSYNNGVKSIVKVTKKQSNIIGACIIIVLPVIILTCGLVVWLKRRHL